MRRARTAGLAGLALAAMVSAAAASARPHAAPAGGLEARAFYVRAEAYPTEPAPGTNETSLGARPTATRAQVSNPPSTAYARAAAADLGLIEGYVGPVGPSVESDTSVGNSERDVAHEEAGVRLEAHTTTDPSASSSADGDSTSSGDMTVGSSTSRSSAVVEDGVLIARAEATVSDAGLGPLTIASGRFDAEVRIDGTREGAQAEGRITLSGSDVDGVPVVIGANGITVDSSQVPAPLLDEMTAAVQQAMSEGGYADIRVVQPKVEIADDGTAATVSGGGVHVRFTNNDPTNNYFLAFTMLGGSAEALLGADLGETGSRPLGPSTPGDDPATPGAGGVTPPAKLDPPSSGPSAPSDRPIAFVEVSDDSGIVSLQRPWDGWPWLLLAVAIAGAAWFGMRRRSAEALDRLADRYLRG